MQLLIIELDDVEMARLAGLSSLNNRTPEDEATLLLSRCLQSIIDDVIDDTLVGADEMPQHHA